ncbi:MAG: hypothetical protein RX318_00440 [bacterium]|nr:hypothetical protein [bacterium]
MAVWPATFVVALVTLALALAIVAWTPTEDRRFLLTAFCLSIVVRWALASLLAVGGVTLGWGDDLFGDARSYFRLGAYLAERVTGQAYWTAVHPSVLDHFNLGYLWNYYYLTFKGGYPTTINLLNLWTYMCGGIFTWFGYSPLAMQFLSGTLFSIGTICFYHVVRPIGGPRPAKLATGLYLLWPSLLLWSVTGLLEAATHAMIWGLWLGVRTALHRGRVRWWLGVVMGLVGFFYLRPVVSLIFLVAVVPLEIVAAWWVGARGGRPFRALAVFLLCGLLVSGTMAFTAKYLYRATGENIFYSLVARQLGGTSTQGTNIYIYPYRFYSSQGSLAKVSPLTVGELGSAFLYGLAHLVFAPFPWRTVTGLQLAALPETLLWSLLCGVAVLGFIGARHRRGRFLLPLVGFTLVIVVALSLGEGNVGTLFRHRGFLVPLTLFFAALVFAPEAEAGGERG